MLSSARTRACSDKRPRLRHAPSAGRPRSRAPTADRASIELRDVRAIGRPILAVDRPDAGDLLVSPRILRARRARAAGPTGTARCLYAERRQVLPVEQRSRPQPGRSAWSATRRPLTTSASRTAPAPRRRPVRSVISSVAAARPTAMPSSFDGPSGIAVERRRARGIECTRGCRDVVRPAPCAPRSRRPLQPRRHPARRSAPT